MPDLGIRPATFRDAQAIDALVAGFDPLRRDLDSWVNQADYHLALIDGARVAGFAARTRHKTHPKRDLVSVYVEQRPDRPECADALYRSVRAKQPLKARLAADDHAGLAAATAAGYVERIRSATHRVDAGALAGPSDAIAVDEKGRTLIDALTTLYEQTHSWDPPAVFTRRYVRQAMVFGAEHIAVTIDDAGVINRSDDPVVAADIALLGALDPTAANADDITRSLVAHLASFYEHEAQPLWFEVDRGEGTNAPLARLITPLAPAEEEVVILTTD
jgi:hypothetical protein